jgi:hypothetical protein
MTLFSQSNDDSESGMKSGEPSLLGHKAENLASAKRLSLVFIGQ